MKILILGKGYTGKVLEETLQSRGEVFATSRSDSSIIEFELTRPETWKNLPKADYTFWTFPAQPLEDVQLFLKEYGNNLGKIIVIGSTGSYLVKNEGDSITEDSPLNYESERVKGEDFIREQGGIVVRASGIYGPHRNPLNWVSMGRVAPSKKFLNLIQVEDLVEILWQAAEVGKIGANYIATSSRPMPWDELIEKLSEKFDFPIPGQTTPSKRSSKIVNGDQTLMDLKVSLKHPHILQGIIDLN